MDWIKDRMREASTYAGLATLTLAVGQLAKVNEAPAIADAVSNAAPALTAGDWLSGLLTFGFGVVAAFKKE